MTNVKENFNYCMRIIYCQCCKKEINAKEDMESRMCCCMSSIK